MISLSPGSTNSKPNPEPSCTLRWKLQRPKTETWLLAHNLTQEKGVFSLTKCKLSLINALQCTLWPNQWGQNSVSGSETELKDRDKGRYNCNTPHKNTSKPHINSMGCTNVIIVGSTRALMMETWHNPFNLHIDTVCGFVPAVLPAFGRCCSCVAFSLDYVSISSYLVNITVCCSFVEYVALSMFAIGHTLQTSPLSCERAHSWIGKTWVEVSSW